MTDKQNRRLANILKLTTDQRIAWHREDVELARDVVDSIARPRSQRAAWVWGTRTIKPIVDATVATPNTGGAATRTGKARGSYRMDGRAVEQRRVSRLGFRPSDPFRLDSACDYILRNV